MLINEVILDYLSRKVSKVTKHNNYDIALEILNKLIEKYGLKKTWSRILCTKSSKACCGC